MAEKTKTKPKAQRKVVRRNGELIVIWVDENGNEIPESKLGNYDLEGSQNDGGLGGDGLPNGGEEKPTKPKPPKEDKPKPSSGGSKNPYPENLEDKPRNTSTLGTGFLDSFFKWTNDNLGTKFDLGTGKTGFSNDTAPSDGSGLKPSGQGTIPGMQNDGTINDASGNGSNVSTDSRLAQLSIDNGQAGRNLPVKQSLLDYAQQGVTAVYGPQYKISLKSGGQEGSEIGTRRHGTLTAGDFIITDPKGQMISGSQLIPLAKFWAANEIGSVGLPTPASGQFLHLDLIGGKTPDSVPLGPKEGLYWLYTAEGENPTVLKSALADAYNNKTPPQYVMDPAAVKQIQTTPNTGLSNAGLGIGNSTIPKTDPVGKGADWNELGNILGGIKQSVGDTNPVTTPANYTPPPVTTGLATTNQALGNVAGNGPPVQTITVKPDGTEVINDSAGSATLPQSVRPSNIPDQNSGLSLINSAGGDFNQVRDAYLDQINIAEGNPNYNTNFGHKDLALVGPEHPNYRQYYNKGQDFSTAFGKYQINYDTWNDLNSGKFNSGKYFPAGSLDIRSEEDQKKAAWALADWNFNQKTGQDLYSYLASKDDAKIQETFVVNGNKWSSLPGGSQPRTNLSDLTNGFKASTSTLAPPVIPMTGIAGGANGLGVNTRGLGFEQTPTAPATPSQNQAGFVGRADTSTGGVTKPSNTGLMNAGKGVGKSGSEGIQPTPKDPGLPIPNSSPNPSKGVANEGMGGGSGNAGKAGGGISNYQPQKAGWNSTPRPNPTPSQTSTGNVGGMGGIAGGVGGRTTSDEEGKKGLGGGFMI